MIFNYKDEQYTFPTLLSEITLSRRIGFYTQYGKDLDEEAIRIEAITDLFEKEGEAAIWQMDLAAKTFAYYTGISLEAIRKDIDIAELLSLYKNEMQALLNQEARIELQQQYEWNGIQWFISTPELLSTNKMCFDEFLTAKEVVRQFNAIGKSKWDALPYLCAIYLRKEGEEFQEEFCLPDNERYQLMMELPLDIALAVGFFLSSIVNIYSTISASSAKASLRELIHPVTLISGAGTLS